MRKILICGSRNWRDMGPISLYLHEAVRAAGGPGGVQVIHGDAAGADRAADRAARKLGIEVFCEPAQWETYGKAAGPIRNQLMLDKYKPDEVIAFRTSGKSNGTDHMIKCARKAGIPVTVISD